MNRVRRIVKTIREMLPPPKPPELTLDQKLRLMIFEWEKGERLKFWDRMSISSVPALAYELAFSSDKAAWAQLGIKDEWSDWKADNFLHLRFLLHRFTDERKVIIEALVSRGFTKEEVLAPNFPFRWRKDNEPLYGHIRAWEIVEGAEEMDGEGVMTESWKVQISTAECQRRAKAWGIPFVDPKVEYDLDRRIRKYIEECSSQ